jgi:phosphotriesterase-related protein
MQFTRREFLFRGALAGVGLAATGTGCVSTARRVRQEQVMTVLGPIPAEELGVTLPHEHVLLDFIGADQVSRDRYDADEVFNSVLPHLQQVKDFGCQSFAECTPAFIGRDPALLKRLAEASRLQILTNTGYYGAGQNKFLPEYTHTESANELSLRWLREWRDGIEETGIRPGFIKIGVDAGPLSEIHRKLVRAAAQTHLISGLTIAAHTGDGTAALNELAVLKDEEVAANAFIWVHAQNEKNSDLHWRIAAQEAWVEFDHISPQTVAKHVELVQGLKTRGLLHRVLVSHDAGWYEVGKPHGGEFRPYDTLFKEFIPALKKADFSDEEIRQLLVINPREAFTIRVRHR